MKKASRIHHRRQVSITGTVILILLLVVIVMPFYIMFVGAFKPNVSLLQVPVDLVPLRNFTIENIQKVLKKTNIWLWMKNSFLISGTVALATAFIGVTAGYAFAKINFRGKNFFFALVMATMMMPKQMLLIPNYLVAYSMNLQNTMIGVILTTIAPAFGVFLSRQFISSLPSTLFDAAEIDGCSELGKFFRIVLPLSMPAVGTISIFAFFACFNDYIWQLIMISGEKLRTLPIGIAFYSGRAGKGEQMALAMLATLPLIVLFIACQKFFIKGVTAGAVKG